jgi:hypothetical protein
MLIGRSLAQATIAKVGYTSLAELEFKVFSQFGDDGIIQDLVAHLALPHKTFIEFGVEDYFESNTRFLLQKDNWSGFVMDGSPANVERLGRSAFYWKHDLVAKAEFVTRANIRALLDGPAQEWGGVGLLHIDLDGNDYWIWQEIDLTPVVVIVEYNSVFGVDRAVTIPYSDDFQRGRAHFSNLYWGTSLKALYLLAQEKGYAFIGCNGAGNNAYFVRRDALNARVTEVPLERGYVASKYRESRGHDGRLTLLRGSERAAAIRGLPVFDVELQREVPF